MVGNQTVISHVSLLGFEELHDMQMFLFQSFLIIYIFTIEANFLTVLILVDQHLHTPMYFFLGNLSCLEMMYSSTILPKRLDNHLTGEKSFFFPKGCITQLYFFVFLCSTECYLLSVMSYDQFLVICKPLHYATAMRITCCIQLTAVSWINGMLFISVYLIFKLQVWLYGPNEIDYFFCETLPLIKLSCSDTTFMKHAVLVLAYTFTFPPFTLSFMSYVFILRTILRIPSRTGK